MDLLPSPQAPPSRRALKVLLVENELGMLEVYSETLERLGNCRVLALQDPEAALQRLEAGERFDLLLTDLVMPRLGGLELLRRARELHPELPGIVLTGYPSPQSLARARELGATRYLTKPLLPAELLAAIREVLSLPDGA